MSNESEKQTRKNRIDKKLRDLGWKIKYYQPGINTSGFSNHAIEEYPTSNGPVDYALFVKGRPLGLLFEKNGQLNKINKFEDLNVLRELAGS